MINAAPKLNGNRPEDFEEIGRRILDALKPLEDALKDCGAECFHSRNYLDMSMRREDIERLCCMMKHLEEIRGLGCDLVDVALDAVDPSFS